MYDFFRKMQVQILYFYVVWYTIVHLMTTESALIWHWLGVLTKKRYDALLQVYSSIDEALEHLDESMLQGLGCREDTIYKTLNRREECSADAYAAELKKRKIELISIEDPVYPAQLRQIGDPPIFLSYKGDLSVLGQPCIGVVGTRNMSVYGKRVVERIVPSLVQAGIVTVSGLALGIDSECAVQTMEAGGKTVAALGHGFAHLAPKEKRLLADRMVKQGGLVLSEFPLDFPADKYTFPARNRIIAGLSLGTLVLEAGEGSGALITADLSNDYGRDVFAVPGQIFDANYAGCHALLAKGHAKLITSADDILQEYSIATTSSESGHVDFTASNEDEAQVYSVLTTMPQVVSSIVEKVKLPPETVATSLTMMELAGAAKNVGNSQWVRC